MTSVPASWTPPRVAVTTEAGAVLRLAVPIVVMHVGQSFTATVGAMIAGQHGETALAAVGLGNHLFFAVLVVGVGLVLGSDPLISQAVGAGDRGSASRALDAGLRVSAGAGVALGAVVVALALGAARLGVTPEVAAATRDVLLVRAPTVWPLLAALAAMTYLQANARSGWLVLSVVVANAVHLPLAWLLVLGSPSLGIPSMGARGAALAIAFVSFLSAAILLRAVHSSREPAPRAVVAHVLRLGGPQAGQLLGEVAAATLVSVMAGRIGDRALAAHYLTFTVTTLTFRIAIGLGAATAVRVGLAVGQGRGSGTSHEARTSGAVGLAIGMGALLLAAVAMTLGSHALVRCFTADRGVAAAALPLFGVAAALQLVDGMQAVASGALRGLGDTRASFLAVTAGVYVVGLPLAALLAFRAGMGVSGLWWGLTVGLSASAATLAARFFLLTARPVPSC